jgi:cyclopropane-fatty-acyl-phospholipid synthase
VHKYVFPGGFIPSREQVDHDATRAGLHLEGAPLSLQADYARTLREWRDRFTARGDEVAALGFDETFRRLWELYLAYSEAGFRAAELDVWQLGFTRR